MKDNHFFAMMSRMRYINRWGLMRNTVSENICEHSLDVAMIAHALGVINNVYFNGIIDPERLAVMGMYHDSTEIITGDMPTPVKYYNPIIRNAYREVEGVAKEELLKGLPDEMKGYYESLLSEKDEEKDLWKYVKAADKLSAYIKCIAEQSMGNHDFDKAKASINDIIEEMDIPEVKFFVDKFIPAYEMTLDESK